MICPYCEKTDKQVKAGVNQGHQRYKCGYCQRRYMAQSRQRGYSEERRHQVIKLHSQGIAIREIARQIDVNPQTVVNWLRRQDRDSAVAPSLTDAPSAGPIPPAIRPSATEKKRATITDVARCAGVSTSTISNYLNRKGHMSAETRQRIESAIEKLHFAPSALVRAIRHRHTRILGVILFGLYDSDVNNMGKILDHVILSGVNQVARQAGYNILLFTDYLYASSPPRMVPGPQMEFLDGHTDGLLWLAPALSDPPLERVVGAGLPVMTMLTRHVPPGAGWVNADNIGAIREAVAHLVQLGHRRIAYAGPLYTSNFLDRCTGYREALLSCDLPYDPALEVATGGEDPWSLKAYGRALDDWLALPSPPTAIVTATDGLAADIIGLLEQRGLCVPKDMSITGFDDVLDARHIGGGLTTIHQPLRQVGQVAAERLIAMINGAPVTECRVTLPAPLVVRNTTIRPGRPAGNPAG